MTEATQRTSDSGVSIWLDDLSRSRIESGSLQDLIANKNVVGVTTNPSIFQKALHEVGPYDPQLKELGKVDVETAVRELTTTDVRNATDIFREVAEKSDFVDGRVSIEVDPRLAHETEATEKQAEELWAKVNRPNAMIKIPATLEGLPAITATLAKGISVNVTLIFSLERYEQVIDAYIEGIAQADANGHDLKHIGSVASFFVSRVDTAVDKLLEALSGALKEKYPGFQLAGAYSPPFRLWTEEDLENMREAVASSGANVVWVGLGCPKQERWMAEQRELLPPAVYVGVGAAFAFHAGTVKRAPRWMQKNGLEWLYRIYREPGRLLRRYVKHNSLFVWYVLTGR